LDFYDDCQNGRDEIDGGGREHTPQKDGKKGEKKYWSRIKGHGQGDGNNLYRDSKKYEHIRIKETRQYPESQPGGGGKLKSYIDVGGIPGTHSMGAVSSRVRMTSNRNQGGGGGGGPQGIGLIW